MILQANVAGPGTIFDRRNVQLQIDDLLTIEGYLHAAAPAHAVKDLQRFMPVCHICFDFLAEFQVPGGAH